MNIHLTNPAHLSPEQIAAWSRLQQLDPAVESPFFRPEFAQSVAEVRKDVEVAVLEEDGVPVGFFPFQRSRQNIGIPCGGALSDYQGVIVAPHVRWSPSELLDGCRLSAWHFDHLVAAQTPFTPFHQVQTRSPYADLSQGFESYKAQRRKDTDRIVQVQRKARKVERELGTLVFSEHTADEAALQTLIDWKVEQCQRTGVPTGLTTSWAVGLLRQILERRQPAFAGVLASLRLGDKLIAVHLGMRSRHVLHSWMLAYDRELAKFSPGLILLVEMLKAAEAQGVTRFDFGKGEMPYKSSFMSGAVPLAEGAIDRRLVAGALWKAWRLACDRIRASPLRSTARVPWRMLRRTRQWLLFR